MPDPNVVQTRPVASPSVETLRAAKPEPRLAPPEPKDGLRETVETVVFVVFLVLLLKAFVAEAFVIPTGSMATTLLGYHRHTTCDRCGYDVTVNASEEADPRNAWRRPGNTVETRCPNCNRVQYLSVDNLDGGDKVLVSKPEYDLFQPQRLDVIVFKYPGKPLRDGTREEGPQKDYEAHNFIKRLWGLPGEKIGIWHGDIYLCEERDGKMHMDIIRKPADKILEMRRIVYDNDYPAKDLAGHVPPRWQNVQAAKDAAEWRPDADGKVFQVHAGDAASWLRYHHRVWPSVQRPGDIKEREDLERLEKVVQQPRLVTDFLDYNVQLAVHWVRDLMLDFEVEIERAGGELTLELISGIDTHQAVFDLKQGTCTLKVLRDGKEVPLPEARADTNMNRLGKHTLRFGNFDERLILWIDGKPIFGDGKEFEGQKASERGPTVADLQPAGIGVRNASVKVRQLQLWRDLYYTREVSSADVSFPFDPTDEPDVSLARRFSLSTDEQKQLEGPRAKPAKWQQYFSHEPKIYPVGPGEYMALGDNSTQSKDSRDWGMVPERLLLGKAVFVYYPFSRFGLIR